MSDETVKTKPIVLGAVAYIAGTFPIAVLWHVVLFKTHYEAFGYFSQEPNFVLGLSSIVIQGILLSILFPLVNFQGGARRRAFKFATILGAFFWTSHVLAFVAKQEVPSTLHFVALETVYLVVQFGLFGLLLSWIYRNIFANPVENDLS